MPLLDDNDLQIFHAFGSWRYARETNAVTVIDQHNFALGHLKPNVACQRNISLLAVNMDQRTWLWPVGQWQVGNDDRFKIDYGLQS